MTPFEIEPTPIAGLSIIRRQRRTDDRGFLERLFEEVPFSTLLDEKPVVQMNHTYTKKSGTIRGMHCQLPPHAEWKVVTCIRGSVFDVVVDLRSKSKTFGKWWGYELTDTNGDSLAIPEGCAHGLQTLQNDVDLVYMHTEKYAPSAEGAINPFNSELAIRWPREISEISDRDQSEARTLDWFKGVEW
jgi:dTDP-4-dehydrorhamnose 3,5-epimerase